MNLRIKTLLFVLLLGIGLIGCQATSNPAADDHADEGETAVILQLPPITAITHNEKPRVVATTSIIGDVVAQVGGAAIDLTVLMQPGQDPHSYEPAARDLTVVADADIIFVNGWDLEENLLDNLASIADGIPIVPVSAGIAPLDGDDDHPEGDDHPDDDHAEEADAHTHDLDPHVWLAVENVTIWSDNVATALATLDPEQTAVYQSNAQAYQAELAALDDEIRQEINTIPAEKRVLVTNHNAFGYFTQAYGLELLGTVIPAMSTLSEPSASDLASLVDVMADHQVCVIFTETTVSPKLAETVTAELQECATVAVLPLYTGSLGTVGSSADSYIGMMRVNAITIRDGLK